MEADFRVLNPFFSSVVKKVSNTVQRKSFISTVAPRITILSNYATNIPINMPAKLELASKKINGFIFYSAIRRHNGV